MCCGVSLRFDSSGSKIGHTARLCALSLLGGQQHMLLLQLHVIIIIEMQICPVITRISQFVIYMTQPTLQLSFWTSICLWSVWIAHLYSSIYFLVLFSLLLCRPLDIFEGGLCLPRGKLCPLKQSLLCLVIFHKLTNSLWTQRPISSRWNSMVYIIPWCLILKGCF